MTIKKARAHLNRIGALDRATVEFRIHVFTNLEIRIRNTGKGRQYILVSRFCDIDDNPGTELKDPESWQILGEFLCEYMPNLGLPWFKRHYRDNF